MDYLPMLIAYASDAGQRPFRPGRHDCALFAAGWVKIATGQGPCAWLAQHLPQPQARPAVAARGWL